MERTLSIIKPDATKRSITGKINAIIEEVGLSIIAQKRIILSEVQAQEFYGKRFLVKDELQPIKWKMESESKQVGNYLCFKATAVVPEKELTWYNFSWGDLNVDKDNPEVKLTQIEAWYTLQIPLKQGPAEYWGLPGLILEVSAGDTTMLCSQVVINPKDKVEIKTPDKGKETNKLDYNNIIQSKMLEMRNNRGRRRG